MGNGKLGALVYGGTKNDTIYLNDITYWTGKPVNPNEGTGKSVWIPRIREALFAENYRRELNIDCAMAHVSYQQDGVTYKK